MKGWVFGVFVTILIYVLMFSLFRLMMFFPEVFLIIILLLGFLFSVYIFKGVYDANR